MKRSILLGVIAAMAASCTVQEADVLMDERTETVFYATFEQPEEDTKVYANEKLLIRWHEDDRLSIFNKLTYNQQYQFTGKTGDNSGGFRKVDGDEFVTGNTINDIVAVYPYQQGTSIAEDEILSVELPGEQVFAQNSFGRGANTMVSVSSGNVLMFKNVCGYLMFSLYGEGVMVSSLTLRGNNGEKLAGQAYVTMPLNGIPSVEMADGSDSITLNCENPVALGATESECVQFWFVVPPITFSEGFSLTVNLFTGGSIEKSTGKSITITRNKLAKMAPQEMVLSPSPEPEAVDLGLSVKWASCNYGAAVPEYYGDYYAWGETKIKSDYSWSSYKWCKGEYNTLTKYNTNIAYGDVDNKTDLDAEDDVIQVKVGGGWRMPNPAEMKELINNCIWSWGTLNGVNGYWVTSSRNGNSIFLPASGCRVNSVVDNDKVHCGYWTSSTTMAPVTIKVGFARYDYYALHFWSFPLYDGQLNFSGTNRYDGRPIRPVYGDPVKVTGVELDKTELTLHEGETATLTATVLPENAPDKSVTWTSSDKYVATVANSGKVKAYSAGTATITATANGGKTAICTVTVEAVSLSAPDDVEAVNLGLPSGLKWASCNVGATKPEEYGAYFAWGETEPKTNYTWLTYKWCNGEYNKLTKYCTNSDYYNDYWDGIGPMDNKTVLDPEDDAAHVNWGGSWRMPRKAEQDELRNNCTWTWTSENGVNGMKVTGPNGKSIFLPVAGNRDNTYLGSAGSSGYYWSSSLLTDFPYYAYNVYFYSGYYNWDGSLRYSGQSVRPVYGELIPVSSVTLEPSSVKLKVGESYILSATISPSNATEKTVQWSTSDESVAFVDANGLVTALRAGTATITAYGSSGVSAECTVTVEAVPSTAPEGVEAVDLGLPSGLKWASMNVGATKPEEYGDYFAWGETEPKSDYSWSTYKWCNGEDNKLTKYCTNSYCWDGTGPMDNKAILDLEDDAAYINWGGSWRMPTDAEWTELRTECTWTWTTQNGVNGRKVTGPNGKSILLPGGGYRLATDLIVEGAHGFYWSSSHDTEDGPDFADGVCFDSDDVNRLHCSRCYGLSVRPVSE